MIVLHDVIKEYSDGGRKVPVLNHVNFSVEAGEFVAIVGPSGSGKSTLLNVLGLLDKPSSGNYEFSGQSVTRMSRGKLARFRNQKIGFVFQSFMLLPRMSVMDNVQVPLLYGRVGRRERKRRVQQALESVGMIPQARKKALKLSGGEKQRVAIARALVNQPELILADEPTGNLDDKTKHEILRIFSDLHGLGRTIIMVTHDMAAAQYAQRVLRFEDGHLRPVDHAASPPHSHMSDTFGATDASVGALHTDAAAAASANAADGDAVAEDSSAVDAAAEVGASLERGPAR